MDSAALRPDPVPGAADLPARPRRRADALDHLARRGAERARVHLALPNQNGFFREQQKPSASVLLTLHPGRTLDRAQVAGIVHLVSSSVPELDPKAVSVLDQSGALLTGGDARAVRGPRRAAAAVREPDRDRLREAHLRAARARSSATTTCAPRRRRHRLLAERGDLGGVQAEPGRRRQQSRSAASRRPSSRARSRRCRAACRARAVEPAAARRDGAARPARRSRCRRRSAGTPARPAAAARR